jgi:glycogen debranching enzyme
LDYLVCGYFVKILKKISNFRKDVPNCGSLYVLIEPQIKVGPSNDPIILQTDAIRCQTVLAKLLGPLDTWIAKLRVGKESGYNMIHFTPIQVILYIHC